MAESNLHRLSEAETLFRSALEGRRRVLGADHPDTLVAAYNLALTLEAEKQFKEAEKLYESPFSSGDASSARIIPASS